MPELAEWLETDGLGGFAMGTVGGGGGGLRARRYHGLLVAATNPPAGRTMLVNGFEAIVHTPNGSFPLNSQQYAPDVIHPEKSAEIESFEIDPWPTWRYRLADGTLIEQEIFMRHGSAATVVVWRLVGQRTNIKLTLRPFISGRDYHALHHENGAFRFTRLAEKSDVRWQPYEGLPPIAVHTNGRYDHEPLWFRNFLNKDERDRGFDATEDLASPGVFQFDLSKDDAVWIVSASGLGAELPQAKNGKSLAATLRDAERTRRDAFPSRLHFSADQYIVKRGEGKSIIAGYPWFADWGRDTFIAMRGLCLAADRLEDAKQILLAWSGTVSQGMLPNRFPDDGGGEPEYNSVDASLWYVIAVHEFLGLADRSQHMLTSVERKALQGSVQAILNGYFGGTRYGIRCDDDGLLAAGEPGVQLTWMDAKVGDHVITPRIGKPVEVQALWLNALWIAGQTSDHWREVFERGRESFRSQFWNAASDCLFDVIDVDHQRGKVDPSFRPNQIFAIGGLPMPLLEGSQARRVVDVVEQHLWTPMGLRTLAPSDPRYVTHYEGGPAHRDTAYHQGTAWPWLLGPFVEAWVRVRDETAQAKQQAKVRFIEPILRHMTQAGLGHISEIADADPPHTPRGCPFQAWSLGELLRLKHFVLADESNQSRLASKPVITV